MATKKVYAVAENIEGLRGTVGMVRKLQTLKKEREVLENEIQNLENEIKATMVKNDTYAFTAAGFNVTLNLQENNRLDTAALQAHYPDIYNEFYVNKGAFWKFNVRAVSGASTKVATTTEVVEAIKAQVANG